MQSSAAKQIVRTGPDLGLPFSPAVKAGGFIYVAGTLATDEKGTLVAGDVQAQTRRVLQNIDVVLKAAGSSLANAVAVTVYLKRASDFAAMNDAYSTFFTADPPTRTTVMSELIWPDALVEMSAIAVPAGAPREVVHPADWIRSPNPYSYAIRSGDTLFLSGLVPRRGKDNSSVEGDMTTQTKAVLDNAREILAAAGMTLGHVVSARVFITDTAQFDAMNVAYRSYFVPPLPARATVRAELMRPEYVVEITLIAVKESDYERSYFNTPTPDGAEGRPNPNLSSAVQVGDRLFLSGTLGNTDATRGDAAAQTRETLSRLGRTLKVAGFGWEHVVESLVYLPAMKDYAAMNAAYGEIFAKDFPARATVGNALVAPDGLVEIMMTAVR